MLDLVTTCKACSFVVTVIRTDFYPETNMLHNLKCCVTVENSLKMCG
jgi:hypothetical protein